MLTSDGWKAITIEDKSIDYGRHDLTGAGVDLTINVWAKVGVYTPMLPVTITPPEPEPVYTDIKYGSLYNWFSATDVRGIANGDFDVPTRDEWAALIQHINPAIDPVLDFTGYTNIGGYLKENTSTYWDSPNTGASNIYGFNGRGVGIRNLTGTFSFEKSQTYIHSKTLYSATRNYYIVLNKDNSEITISLTVNINALKQGNSIRLVRPATESDPIGDGSPCAPYIGNDGKVYRTVRIGTQVWTADNLAETKFANGDTIPTVTDNGEWAALTTGARCAYDNDESNVLI